MNRKLFVVLVAVAAVALGWWFLRADRADSAGAARAVAPAREEPVPDRANGAASLSHEVAVDPARTAEAVTPPKAVAPAGAHPEILVQVLDRGTAMPVAGATVRWANSLTLPRMHDPSRPRWNPDVEELLHNASETVTDEAGVARIDASVFPGFIVARKGELFGLSSAYEGAPVPIQVLVSNDSEITIQVVDGAGKPVAGVPVGLRSTTAQLVEPDAWQGTTEEPDGLARVGHLQKVFEMLKPPAALFAHVAIPALNPVHVPIDPANLPKEPIRLVLPPCGSVEIFAHDSEGRPIAEPYFNLAEVTQDGVSQVDDGGSLSWGAHTFDASSIQNGRALYPFVGLGLDLYADAIALGQSAKTTGPGPHVLGERVTFDLDLGPALPVLTGRLLDGAGQPIPDRNVQSSIDGTGASGGASATSPTRTDSTGRFRITLPLRPDTKLRASLELRPYGPGPGEGGLAQVDLDARIHAGENDLGDLAIEAVEVLVSGRIVDDRGMPVPNAIFGIDTIDASKGPTAWTTNSQARGTCTDSGAFEVKGPRSTGRMRIRTTRSGHVDLAPLEVDPGTRGVTITLSRASEIAGKVLLDEAASGASILVQVTRAGDTELEKRTLGFEFSERTHVQADGSFHLPTVRPGEVELVVKTPGRGPPLFVLTGLRLLPGERLTDARLESIDLRGMVKPLPVPGGAKRD